uniref:protein SMAX1-LIKE 3-like n=1 Tax=Erigeron canadensis TaxID=72917 RepID=UPI001CB96D95|nr:protein SMAX1-LIKE 3-like [Erigeron canadensis]
MRPEGYTVQHTLTPESATVVKQALGLARRRGHAQVTPLHVASAMLTSPTGLLRKACLEINTHPLQCKALELCFNVSLNRLPTYQSSPIMLSSTNHQSHHPSLSNALVVAFKRALAHQRRGSIENQVHQPVLALKVEVEQLIISILDDPSVSRVMREAGFSSTQIKKSFEQSVSVEISSHRPLANSYQAKENIKPILQEFHVSQDSTNKSKLSLRIRDEDVMSVIDTMMETKRKNIVVIRECLVSADDIVRGVMDKFERGNNMVFPGNLRFVQFISLSLHSLSHLSREEIENKIKELAWLLKSHVDRGVILYLGDLKWVSDYWAKYSDKRLKTCYYSPMEHMIMELSRLMFGFGDSRKLWLMGIANSQTYMSCKTGHPSLETLWDLFPYTTPVGGLDLTLNLDRQDSPIHQKLLTCCGECSENFKTEAKSITNYLNNESIAAATTSTLPLWLQQYKGKKSMQTTNEQERDRVGSLCKKWNTICSSLHKQPHFLDKAFQLPSPSSVSSTTLHEHHQNWPIIPDSNKVPKEHQFFTFEVNSDDDDGFDEGHVNQPVAVKPDLLSNPNSSPNSASCSEANDDNDERFLNNFTEISSENINILTKALEKRVPRQKEIVPEIVSTILRCRAGLSGRKGKEDTWLFFLGADNQGKEMISKELATVVFGSKNNFLQISPSCYEEPKSNLTEDDQELISNKRARNENGQSYIDRFADAVEENASRVFFIEDLDQVEYQSQMGIYKAIESGKITQSCGRLVDLKDAIVILSCENFTSCSPMWQKHRKSEPAPLLDLNIDARDIDILSSVDKHVIFNI